MQSHDLQHEIGRVGTILGRGKNLRVVYQGTGAKTNGAVVYLPALPLNMEVDDDFVAVMRGFMDHEAGGHVRTTDWPAVNEWANRSTPHGKAYRNVLRRHVQNALEDMMIERPLVREYPGIRENLLATTTWVNKRFLKKVADGEITDELASPSSCAALAITWTGRKGQGYGGETADACLGAVTDDWLKAKLVEWEKLQVKCASTTDTIALAEAIAKEIEQEQEDRKPPPEPEPEEQEQEARSRRRTSRRARTSRTRASPMMAATTSRTMRPRTTSPARAMTSNEEGDDDDGSDEGEDDDGGRRRWRSEEDDDDDDEGGR